MSGYSESSTDPWAAIRARQAKEAQAAQEANRPGGTQTFQSVRKLWNAILDIRSTVSALQELLLRMPQVEGNDVTSTAWPNGSAAWTSIATFTFARRENYNRVVVSANASVRGLSDVPGALAFRARLVINGVASTEFQAQVSGGAFVAGVSYPSLVREITPLTSSVVVELQVDTVMNTFAYDRVATLSATAAFSRV